MYGLVHAAARNMILETMGDAAWSDVLRSAGLGEEHVVSGQNYPDSITFRLIAAISAKIGRPQDEVLRRFGQYWIGYSARSPFGGLYRIAGSDLQTFLVNLNRMHSSVQTTMPGARMPVFELVKDETGLLELQYDSERKGLQPFVEGLLQGLLSHFGETGTVIHHDTPDGDVFRIEYQKKRDAA